MWAVTGSENALSASLAAPKLGYTLVAILARIATGEGRAATRTGGVLREVDIVSPSQRGPSPGAPRVGVWSER